MLICSYMGGKTQFANKNKGFTLIELLAVIVILAIIAVIATPIITGIIEDAKKESFSRSVEGVVETTKLDVFDKISDNNYTYTITDGVIDNLGSNVKVNNTEGMNGTIRYNSDGEVSYAIHNDKWCVVKSGNSETSTTKYEGSCALSTDPSAFTYEDTVIVESLEAGDNCVNWFKENKEYGNTEANNYCYGGKLFGYGRTLIETIEGGYLDILELEEAEVIKNAVYILSIEITGYNKAIGSPDVVIPSQIDGKPVAKIGENAFRNNQLTSVTIPNSVTSIEYGAFSKNQLTNIVIPNSVTFIGGTAFNDNQLPDSQAFIYVRNSDGSIDNTTLVSYGGARKENVVIPSSVTNIQQAAFIETQLKSVTIPNSVTNIGVEAFSNNALTSITIPNSVTIIGEWGFSNNELASVTIENSSTKVCQATFRGNPSLTTVNYGGVDTEISEIYRAC